MRPVIALIIKDLKGYFDQPTGYILLVVFSSSLSFLFFKSALDTSQASLRPLFDLLPWFLTIFVPAATMRLFAEEERDGTLEILFTQPIRGWSVLLAKFAAGNLFVFVAITATVEAPLLLGTAGDLDGGAIVAQYIGSLFLAASLVAIGLFASSLTRNQVVAFMLGLALTAVLMFLGLDLVLESVPSAAAAVVQGLSPLVHFSNIARGVLALRDVVYFAAIVAAFLAGAHLSVRGKSLSHRSGPYRNLQAGVAGLVVVSLLVGWFGDSIGGRLDLTESRRYTLSSGMKSLLSGLDDVLTIKMYASDDLPVEASLVRRDVDDFLDDMASASSLVRVVRIQPQENEDAEFAAQRAGVTPVEFNVRGQDELLLKRGYLGLAMTYLDRQEAIPFIQSPEALEYQAASMINRMTQTRLKTVAFLGGHGEKTAATNLQGLAASLRGQYEVRDVEPAADDSVDLSGVDVLVVAGPTAEVPEVARQALVRYLDAGGNVLALIDRVTVGQYEDGLVAQTNQSNFGSFVESYGVTVLNDLVYDARFNETVPLGGGPFPISVSYPYWPRATAVESRVTGDVESVVLAWVSTLSVRPVEGVEAIPLLETSPFAGVETPYFDVTPGRPGTAPVSAAEPRLLAVALTGPATAGGGGESTYRMVVIGDSDWLSDGGTSIAPENIVPALNTIDWLAQEDSLAAIRSKLGSSRRLLFESNAHRNLIQYGSLIGVPLLLAWAGLARYARRRAVTRRVYVRGR